ncbi:hypothetical protein LTR85_006042 [Meristemomyces frigidus]|nr:hypothetical protein LTR85_006042 [Meristemomyces frigidus]
MADTTAASTPTLVPDSPGRLVGDSPPRWQDDTTANVHIFSPVARMMKAAIPENAHIHKEAKECMQECVSEFISFVTNEAAEKVQQERRRTVNGEDILFAMASLGFENYAEALKMYLFRYRQDLMTKDRRTLWAEEPAAPRASGSDGHGAREKERIRAHCEALVQA